MTAILRTATQADLAPMQALYRHLDPDAPPADPAAAEAALEALLASRLAHLLVADQAGVLVASCLLLVIPNLTRGVRPFAIIENVVTHADFRRQGLATRLLHLAQERARAAGCYKLMLAAGRREEGILRFYERAGFTRGGKTFFEMRWLD
ncbi:GNAT family N-acetyltransferase [Sphingobium nicotianae]|nr:GNAT family N-acetyltransferase [Sphingobium nicotianae]